MSTWISTMFHQGGASMFSILYLGVPALMLALLHALRPRRWSWWTAAGVTALVFAVGVLGWQDSRSRVDEWLERETAAERDRDPSVVDEDEPVYRSTPSERAMMREQGYLEASRPLQFGSLVAGLCLLPLVVGELRRRRARRAIT